ncbi:MAG TPA: hypothetical protein VFG72_08560 [Marmoricola sp.]|nr:hypothetical protein [Marmoricola sp.]
MRTQWTGRDTSGICGYSTARHHDEYYPDEVPWSPWSNAESITLGVSDYDDQEGGGMDKLWGLEVRARDCAGNVAQKFVAFAPIVFQQDGRSYSYGDLEVSTNGTWRTSRCACWAAGTALSTSAKGARYNIDVPLRGDAVGTTPVALVMERAPDRGKARVLVDGVRVATIDTRAPRKVHRSIVWVGRLNPGAHTLSVVNVGTKGRSRIDVDALAVSPGFSVDASYR